MSEIQKPFKFTLIPEKVASEDLFEGNTHQNLADVLYNIILNGTIICDKEVEKNSNNEVSYKEEGYTVGLEGGWGSGKSTIIELLRNRLKDNPDIHFFYFDAWAHEGDHLRRIFLEKFIDSIYVTKNEEELECIVGWKDIIVKYLKKRWSKLTIGGRTLFNRLFRRKIYCEQTKFLKQVNELEMIKTKIVNRHQKKSIFQEVGISTAFGALCMSFGIAIVSGTAGQVTINPDYEFHWMFIFGVFIGFIIPFVVFLMKLFNKKDEVVYEVLSEPEKTSVEFEKYFKDIILTFMDQEDSNKDDKTKTKKYSVYRTKKLVIVIDNLDRIDSEDSLKLWSTLQTFLQHRNHSNGDVNSNLKNIWTIVPYDDAGLKKLWEGKSQGEKDFYKRRQSCPKSFFDKCFQLRFEVPTQVLSGWEDFFYKKVGNENDGVKWPTSLKTVAKNVLRWTRDDLTESLTPREIITYINQITALYQMRQTIDTGQEPVSGEAIAYYVALKYLKGYTREDFEKGLLNGGIPEQKIQSMLTENLKESLCGILYSVVKEKGGQILLRKEFKNAFLDYSIDSIDELYKDDELFLLLFKSVFCKLFDSTEIMLFIHSFDYAFSNRRGNFEMASKREPYKRYLESQLKRQVKDWTSISYPTKNNVNVYSTFLRFIAIYNEVADKVIGLLVNSFKEKFSNPSFSVKELLAIHKELLQGFPDDRLKWILNESDISIGHFEEMFPLNGKESSSIRYSREFPSRIEEIIDVEKPIPEWILAVIEHAYVNGIRGWADVVVVLRRRLEQTVSFNTRRTFGQLEDERAKIEELVRTIS